MPLHLHMPREPRKIGLLRQAFRLAFVVVLASIAIIALTPGPSAPPRILGFDKVEHFAAFAVLAILAQRAWPNIHAWGIATALLVYGGIIEILQASPVLMRAASFGDWAADAVGIAGGFAILTLFQRLKKFRLKPAKTSTHMYRQKQI